MKMIYNVEDKPAFSKLLVYAFQQVLAIMAATIAVPTIIGLPAQIPAAILGAGIGTIVYLLFTRFKSPVCISSSFAFLNSLGVAIAFGYCGIIVGGILAGLVYVVIAIVIHFAGTKWVSKLMPPVIIGPTVALIGLSLAGSAMGDIVKASASAANGSYNLIALLCGLITFVTIIVCSIQKKKKGLRLIPFIIGIGVGYGCALVFTLIGHFAHADYLMVLNWSPIVDNFTNVKFTSFFDYPRFALVEAINELAKGHVGEAILAANKDAGMLTWAGFGEIALAFIPVALVVFAEHIADHKNLGSIIDRDLVEGEPGLKRTLLGDGVGSIAGTVFGICPNTTYGESVGCVAITRNASVRTIFVAAIMCIILSFFKPIMVVLQSIPNCVMGGVCLTLYGFIAVSGLKMFKDIDLGENKNLFTVSAILIAGIGGLSIKIPYLVHNVTKQTVGLNELGQEIPLYAYDRNGQLQPILDYVNGQVDKTITITAIATALIIGICTYAICNYIEKKQADLPSDEEESNSLMAAPIESGSTYEVGESKTDKE